MCNESGMEKESEGYRAIKRLQHHGSGNPTGFVDLRLHFNKEIE